MVSFIASAYFDSVLVNVKTTLNGTIIINSIRHVMNNMVNFAPNSGTLASTDHTTVVLLLGRSVIVE